MPLFVPLQAVLLLKSVPASTLVATLAQFLPKPMSLLLGKDVLLIPSAAFLMSIAIELSKAKAFAVMALFDMTSIAILAGRPFAAVRQVVYELVGLRSVASLLSPINICSALSIERPTLVMNLVESPLLVTEASELNIGVFNG